MYSRLHTKISEELTGPVLYLPKYKNITHYILDLSALTLKMEAAYSFKTLVDYKGEKPRKP
jgi:hypothetical protein